MGQTRKRTNEALVEHESVTKDLLLGWMERQQSGLISIHLPTTRRLDVPGEDPIRFKNLLTRLESGLKEMGKKPRDIENRMLGLHDLQQDSFFWKTQKEGLMVLNAPDGPIEVIKLSEPVNELAVLGQRFHLKPAIAHLTTGAPFYVLALSRNVVKLFELTETRIHEEEIPDLPDNLADAMNEDPEKSLQFHSTASPAARKGGKEATYHGHGLGKDVESRKMEQYFRMVDEAVCRALPQAPPLILAAIDRHAATYRNVAQYQNILAEHLPGNPDRIKDNELHDNARTIMRSREGASREDRIEQVGAQVEQGYGTSELETALVAAHLGQVDSLILAKNQARWGQFNPQTERLVQHEAQSFGDEDLLDLLAVATYRHGGDVHIVEESRLPDNTPLLVKFRRSYVPQRRWAEHAAKQVSGTLLQLDVAKRIHEKR